MKIVDAFTVANLDEFAPSDDDEQTLKQFLLDNWELFDTIRANTAVGSPEVHRQIEEGILSLAIVSFMAGRVYQDTEGRVMVAMSPRAMAEFLAFLTEPVAE